MEELPEDMSGSEGFEVIDDDERIAAYGGEKAYGLLLQQYGEMYENESGKKSLTEEKEQEMEKLRLRVAYYTLQAIRADMRDEVFNFGGIHELPVPKEEDTRSLAQLLEKGEDIRIKKNIFGKVTDTPAVIQEKIAVALVYRNMAAYDLEMLRTGAAKGESRELEKQKILKFAEMRDWEKKLKKFLRAYNSKVHLGDMFFEEFLKKFYIFGNFRLRIIE